jgi:hypothetical protein
MGFIFEEKFVRMYFTQFENMCLKCEVYYKNHVTNSTIIFCCHCKNRLELR